LALLTLAARGTKAGPASAGDGNAAVGTTGATVGGQQASKAAPQQAAPSSPASPLVDSMPRIGLDSGDIVDSTPLSNAAAPGPRIMRVSVSWSVVAPSGTDPSHYNWTVADHALGAHGARGRAPLGHIG